jgi:hypothetical protein
MFEKSGGRLRTSAGRTPVEFVGDQTLDVVDDTTLRRRSNKRADEFVLEPRDRAASTTDSQVSYFIY